MDNAPLMRALAQVLNSLLPKGVDALTVYSTNDDPELDALGRDVICFFSSTIPLSEIPRKKSLPSVLTAKRAVARMLQKQQLHLSSLAIAYYGERQRMPESVGFRVYVKLASR